jgi:hypothetical protein
MELLNIITARAVWLFDISELNPRGKSVFPEVLEWMKETYNFESAPKTINEVDETKALVFSRGTFQVREEIFVDVELKIYSDGFIANTWSSTHDAEVFLEDALKSASKEFSLAFKPDIIRRKLFLSEMNVKSVKNLVGVNPTLAAFADKIAEHLSASMSQHFEFSGVTFWPVQEMSLSALSPFRFERKSNTFPSERKYYSVAPLHTDDHIKLLDWFETNLMT